MPTPGTTHRAQSIEQRVFDALLGDDQQPATRSDVRQLTAAVERLAALLQPMSTVILTGAEVHRAFADLRSTAAGRRG